MADLLGPVDYFIFFGSLVLIMAVGLWAGRREESSSDYFLAGRDARCVHGGGDRLLAARLTANQAQSSPLAQLFAPCLPLPLPF